MALLSWRSQLENRTAPDSRVLRAALIAAKKSRAVQHALLVKHQVAIGVSSVRAALEAVKHLFCPLAALRLWRSQFKDCPAVRIDSLIAGSVTATVVGRAI